MLRRRYLRTLMLSTATALTFTCLAQTAPASALADTGTTTVVVDQGDQLVVMEGSLTTSAITAMAAGPYVALGDSYSSGEGATPFDSGTNTSTDKCHRSAYAYPRVFAAHSTTYGGGVTHVACAGAATANLYSSYQGEPAQLSALSSSTGLVTVTIGGNDAGFASVVTQCVTTYWEFWLPNCQQYYTSNDSNNLYRKIDGLRGTLAQTYRDIRSRAGNAAVWVLTYPHLFHGSCPSTGAPLRPTDADWLNTVANRLADVIILAAQDAGVTGVIDERDAFSGHEICTSAPWVNGYTWSGTIFNPISVSFHPTSAGYSKEADVVRAVTGIS